MNHDRNDRIIFWLDSFSGISLRKKTMMLSFVESPRELFDHFDELVDSFATFCSQDEIHLLAAGRTESFLENQELLLERTGAQYITILDERFPEFLRNLDEDDPPLVLYYKGDVNLLTTQCISVVGTRTNSLYGKDVTESFVRDFVESGLTVVSGIGDGIERLAMEAALDNDGKAICFTPGGIHCISPVANERLANQIAEKGLLISEFRPSERIRNYHYSLRNRLIAGISRVTFLVEAGVDSNALTVGDFALKYGRELYVVPSNIDSRSGVGTNRLLRNGFASLALTPDDVTRQYEIDSKFYEKEVDLVLNAQERQILELLSVDVLHLDTLSEYTSIPAGALIATLSILETKDVIKRLPGNRYKLNPKFSFTEENE